MAGENIAEGQVKVGIDTGAAEAGLKKLEADFQRSMSAIDRARAQATVDADITKLDRAIDDAKRKLDELGAKKAKPSADLDTKQLDAEIAAAEAKIKALGKEKATIRVDSKELRDANRLMDISARKQAEMSKQYERTEKSAQQAAMRRSKAAEQEARDLQRRGQLQARALRDNDRFSASQLKAAADVDKLRESYAKLAGERVRLERKTGRPGGIFRTDAESRSLAKVRSAMDLTEHKIRELGGAVDDIDPDLERGQGALGRWANSLSSVRVQMGFFSATLRQMAFGVVGLGPVLTGLLGSATSVVGVLGTGLAGAAATGAAGLAGLITSAAGVGFVIAPMVSEFKTAVKASKALDEAQLKYGKGSEQVKTAQERLNNTLKGVSPIARQAVKDYGGIKSTWHALTDVAKPAVFDAFGSSLKTVQALLPGFAHQSVATTKVAGKAWEGWMKSLRSPEAKQALDQVMSGFRGAIPGIASGLGSIAAAFGRVSASASKLLPGLSNGFADWAGNLEQSIGQGRGLDDNIERLVGHMKDLGHLASSSGSLITHMLSTSADSGDDLVKSLTNVTDRWDKWVQSAHGQESLKNFFGDAADETEQLFSVLGQFTQILFQIGRATAPVSHGFLTVLTTVGDIVQALSGFAPIRGMLAGIGAVLAGMWAVGKVKLFIGAVTGAIDALKGLAAANAVADVASGGGLLGFLGGKGSRGLGQAEREASRAGMAFGETAGDIGLMSAAFGPAGLAVGGFVAALLYLDATAKHVPDTFEKASHAFNNTGQQLQQTTRGITRTSNEYNDAIRLQQGATNAVAAARQKLIKLEQDGAPMAQRTRAAYALADAERQQAGAVEDSGRAAGKNVKVARETLQAAKDHVKALKEESAATKQADHRLTGGKFGARGGGAEDEVNSAKNVAKAEQDVAKARKEVAAATRAAELSEIPYERQKKGNAALNQETIDGLHKLSATIGTTATKKIGNFVDPKQVQQITNLGNRLTKLGQGSTVKKIAVNSSGADQTIGKLRSVQAQATKISGKTAKLNVGTKGDAQAAGKLTRLAQLSQRIAGARPTLHILANADNATQAANRLQQKLQQVAHQKYQAVLSAADRTSGPRDAAYHHAREFASQKYQAILNATDNATAPAKRAKQASDSVKGQYAAHISAPGASQAAQQIQSVVSALQGVQSKTATVTVNYVQHGSPSGGRATGGASEYTYVPMPGEKAVVEPGGRSRRVNRPTMLTGEEGPRHPEFVIATNPAYSGSNERYLEEAAGSLGKEVVPAYAKGKGGAKKKTGSKGSSAGAEKPKGPGPHPPPINPKRHTYLPSDALVFSKRFEQLERDAENEEGHYSSELEHEEREITAGRMENWNYALLRKFKTAMQADYKQIKSPVLPDLIKDITGKQKTATSTVSGIRKELSHVGGTLGSLEHDYAKMEKNKNESQKDFNAKKRAKKFTINEWKKRQKKLKEERDAALKIIQEAKKELHELHTETEPSLQDSLQEVGGDLQYLNDVESGVVEAPYAETAKEGPKPMDFAKAELIKAEIGGDIPGAEAARQKMIQIAEQNYAAAQLTPDPEDDIETGEELKQLRGGAAAGGPATIGEQTATLSSARQNLFQQFASNVTGPTSAMYKPPVTGSAVGATVSAFTAPSGVTSSIGAQKAMYGGVDASTESAGPVTVNKVTNNFAAPPPDPHTWTKQQTFELGALA